MTGLKDKYQDYFKIGAAVSTRTIKSHAELLKTHFNSLTCENETKFSSLQPHENSFNFRKSDKIVQFARDNQMAMRGHTLAWHNQTSKWLFDHADKETVLSGFKKHIEVVAQRYEKDFYCWDVANEAIEDKSDIFYRVSPWTKIVGEDFMDYAFRYTREILPDTMLFYNDYNEAVPGKRDKIYELVKGMLDRGIPIDGVGMQCHWNIYDPSMDDIRRAVEKYADLGLKIHVTEMDISLYAFEDNSKLKEPTEKMLEMQAKLYGDSFALFREYKGIIENVTLWGVADDATWLSNFPHRNRRNWPLLFDDNHEPKEAFYRVMDF